jgi:serine/threonine-protein kinase RsbW
MTPGQTPFDGSSGEPLVFVAALAIGLAVAARLLRRRQIITLRVPAQLAYVRLVIEATTQAAQKAGLDEHSVTHCHVAVDEACTNIVRHAYGGEPGGIIEAEIEAEPGKCTIILEDHGKPFDPEQVAPPRLGKSLGPGGLGLYFMQTLMDEVTYTPSDTGNRLVMVKRQR